MLDLGSALLGAVSLQPKPCSEQLNRGQENSCKSCELHYLFFFPTKNTSNKASKLLEIVHLQQQDPTLGSQQPRVPLKGQQLE